MKRQSMPWTFGLLVSIGWAFGFSSGTLSEASPPSERRAKLLREAGRGAKAVPALAAALDDKNPVVRHTAARLLCDIGEPARKVLAQALGHSDFLVRRTALNALCTAKGIDLVPLLAKALKDENDFIRLTAVTRLVALTPRTNEINSLLKKARMDKADTVKAVASRALWNFHSTSVSMRVRKNYDHDIKVAKSIKLPKDGWKFKLDPGRQGHVKKWFVPGFDDSRWDTISIEQAWQKAGYQYIGVTWYRRTIIAPAEQKHIGVDLRFEGVDENAWVWVNGQYCGDHDIGPEGWNQPFLIDITHAIKWGQKNQITVRTRNTKAAGGIWRPVYLEILE